MKIKRILCGILSFVMAFMLVAYMPDTAYAETTMVQEAETSRNTSREEDSLTEERNLPEEGLAAEEKQDVDDTKKEEATAPKEGLEAEENQEENENKGKEDAGSVEENSEEEERKPAEEHTEAKEEAPKPEESTEAKEETQKPEESTEAVTEAPKQEEATEGTKGEASKPEESTEAATEAPKPEETTEATTEAPKPEETTEAVTEAPKPEETTEVATETPKQEETTAADETSESETEGSSLPGHLATPSNAAGSGSQGGGSKNSQKESQIPTMEELEAMSMEEILELFWNLDEEDREKLVSLMPEEDQEEFFEYMWEQALGETEVVERNIQSFTEVAPFLSPISRGKSKKMSRSRTMADMEEMGRNSVSWANPEGVVTKKSISSLPGEEGKYELTLEAYVEGQVSLVTEEVPTDIILVLDESGSMGWDITTAQYTKVEGRVVNHELYSRVQDKKGTLTYKLEDGTFVNVEVEEKDYIFICYYYYSYINSNGEKVTIESKWKNGEPYNNRDFELEKLYWHSEPRVNVLKDSLHQFVGNVAAIDEHNQHRIAIVGFSDDSNIKTGNQQPEGALISVRNNNEEVNADLTDAIDGLQADGATRADLGLGTAKDIFEKDSKKGETRNRVVIMFTDGVPTSHSAFSNEVANSAIRHAKSMKNDGVTIYTIGIFDGANPAEEPIADQTNRYMHYVSSNYPQAVNLSNGGSTETKGYYLAAKDSQDLVDIFEQISQEVGSPDYPLDSSTVVKDVITPEFKILEGTDEEDISVYTANYLGNGKWSDQLDSFKNAEKVINGKTVEVSNFDFQAEGNYVAEGTEPRGKKLVIKIPIEPDYSGTFGGSREKTNGEDSGLWKDGMGVTPFTPCDAYIPIRYKTNVKDQAVYLTNQPDFKELIQYEEGFVPNGVNNRNVDISYTFKKGETEVAVYTISSGASKGNIEVKEETLWESEDTDYTVSCTVKAKGGSDPVESVEVIPEKKTAKVYVLKPTVTFKDSQIYLGEKPESYDANKDESSTVWENESKPDNLEVLEDEETQKKPVITYKFSPSLENGEWKEDTYVKAKIMIGENDITQYTTILHGECDCKLNKICQFEAEKGQNKGQFIVHVIPCTLTIHKAVEGDKLEVEDQVFLFQVSGQSGQPNSGIDLLISITGTGSRTITGFPTGTYTVTEKENWSWRYEADGVKTATLNPNTPDVEVTVINHLTNRQWLSDEAQETNRFHGNSGPAAVKEVAYLREDKYEF